MARSIDDLITPATADDYVTKMMTIAAALGLRTTAWQAGGVTRTLIRIFAEGLAAADVVISTFAHAGFLKFAASVTDDPSVARADGTYPTGGWLDVVGQSVYNVTRQGATYAAAPVSLIDATGVPYGPFAVGTYHLVNPSTKATYSNSSVLTIAASATTVGDFVADHSGSGSSGAASALSPVTSLVGVTVDAGSAGVFLGSNAESNADYLERCLEKLAALGPKVGPDGAYAFFAKSATLPTTEEGGGGLTLAGGPITRVTVRTVALTGVVQVFLANAAGAPSGPDVTVIDTYLHDVCVPDAVTEVTFAAGAATIAAVIHVSVRSAYDTAATTTAVQTAIATYIDTLPIGGVDIDGAGTLGVPIEAVKGAVFALVASDGTRFIENITLLTLNGVAASATLAPTQVAVASPAAVVTRTVVS